MPIRSENKDRYPKDWKKVVVPRIRARSGNRCECMGHCGGVHVQDDNTPLRCERINGDVIDNGKDMIDWPVVVLTVAHLDHQPENCDDANLLHMCQRCHNRYDAPMRRRGMKERARAAKAVGDLLS